LEEFEKKNKIALVGCPNVGKSVVFGALTGKYAAVSNYPGTTVEVTRGRGKMADNEYEVIDTPGMYSLLPMTEEERVAKSILAEECPSVVVQVADAKNLERTLHLTLQLLEAELPVILDLNLMDEAERLGTAIDLEKLEQSLSIPVIGTVATRGRGIDLLKRKLHDYKKLNGRTPRYDPALEDGIERIVALLPGNFVLSKRTIALFLLQEDPEAEVEVKKRLGEKWPLVEEVIESTRKKFGHPLSYIVAMTRQREIDRLLRNVRVRRPPQDKSWRFSDTLGRVMMHPLGGIPILLLALYGLYEFVGVLGAQIAVDFLEDSVFGEYINPFFTSIITWIIPWKTLQDLFVGEFGVITLGLRYAVAIILPIVTTFFLAFSIIEDTGYLPRLAMMIDRLFKKLGLNGRAVIPIVLGFGCDTMATMVTRTLETKRERVIASLLLALAIPCSAQIGVILGLLAGRPAALWLFVGVMSLIFVLVGYLAAKIMPGEKPLFFMEIPPLRWPKISNILSKTYTRMEWYFKEILPIFIMASGLIWLGRITGVFDLLIDVFSYPVGWIGLPRESANAFLYGFFRRDFGAAGLYDLKETGALAGIPLVVSVVTMALFMPCIAQLSITLKERGWRMALAMAAFIFPFAFAVGGALNYSLRLLGVTL
jgi:ferrous iron transport protein B